MPTLLLTTPVPLKSYQDNLMFNSVQLDRELFIDWRDTLPRLRIGDGSTPGGYPLGSFGINGVATPVITSPLNGLTGVLPSPLLMTSQFNGIKEDRSADTQAGAIWEISTDSTFLTSTYFSGEDSVNLTSINLLEVGATLPVGVIYARVKHTSKTGGVSEWSTPISFTVAASTPSLELQVFKSSDIAAGDGLGSAVAISPDKQRLAVSASREDANGLADAGSVYISAMVNGQYVETQKLTDPNPVAYDYYGTAITFTPSGDLIVSAPYLDDTTGATITNAGAVYVYSPDSSGFFVLKQTITSPTAIPSGLLGMSIDISGDGNTMVLGRIDYNLVGAALVYVKNNTGLWVWSAELTPTTSTVYQRYGNSVSINFDGTAIAVGTNQGALTSIYGRAFVYTKSGTLWTEAELFSATPTLDAFYGDTVEFDKGSGHLFVSEPGTRTIHIYAESAPGVWTATIAALTAVDVSGGQYAMAVAHDVGLLFVGTPYVTNAVSGASTGAVAIYKLVSGAWTALPPIVSSTTGAGGLLGSSIGCSKDGDYVIAGAPSDSTLLASAGSALILG